MVTTNDHGAFETQLPSNNCQAKILGGPKQLYVSRKTMVTNIMKVDETDSYTTSQPLSFYTSCPLSQNHEGKCGTPNDASKTVDLPLPREWGLAPSSYYIPFMPIIGIPWLFLDFMFLCLITCYLSLCRVWSDLYMLSYLYRCLRCIICLISLFFGFILVSKCYISTSLVCYIFINVVRLITVIKLTIFLWSYHFFVRIRVRTWNIYIYSHVSLIVIHEICNKCGAQNDVVGGNIGSICLCQ